VQDRLKRVLKILSRRAAKKPLLTEKMKKRSLAFAKKYSSWTERDWARVMYGSKSTFRLVNMCL
jgi:Cft2 family RNA processing exonuclease